MKAFFITIAALFILSSCTLAIKNERTITGSSSQSLSFTVAPLVSLKRVDVLPNGEQHTANLFAVAPIPEKTQSAATTTVQGGKTTVTETSETKNPVDGSVVVSK